MKSKTAITNGHGSFAIGEIVIQAPGDDEVRVEINASGPCHTDYDSLRWGKQIIIGHEDAGEVELEERDVPGVAPGDMWLFKPAKLYLNLHHRNYRPQTGFPNIKHFEDNESVLAEINSIPIH